MKVVVHGEHVRSTSAIITVQVLRTVHACDEDTSQLRSVICIEKRAVNYKGMVSYVIGMYLL